MFAAGALTSSFIQYELRDGPRKVPGRSQGGISLFTHPHSVLEVLRGGYPCGPRWVARIGVTRSTQACFLTADHTVCVCVSHTHTPTHTRHTAHGSRVITLPQLIILLPNLNGGHLTNLERRAPAHCTAAGRTEDGKKSKGKKRKMPENRSSASAFWSLRTARTRARPLHLSSPRSDTTYWRQADYQNESTPLPPCTAPLLSPIRGGNY